MSGTSPSPDAMKSGLDNSVTAPMPDFLRKLDDQEGYQPLGAVDIVWTNLQVDSDFKNMRFTLYQSLPELLVQLGKTIELAGFDHVYSVSASRFALFITVATTKSIDELQDALFLNL